MLHVENIARGFLSTLGPAFLELLYQAIDEATEAVLITEEQDGRVVGFVAGGLGMAAIYRQLLRHPLRLVKSLLPSLIRPERIRRMLEVAMYGSRASSESPLPRAELLSIAVDPIARRTGVAARLYSRLQREFAARGIDAFRITVGDSLGPAHKYYQRMGAVPVGRIEVHAGESSSVYVQKVAAQGSSK